MFRRIISAAAAAALLLSAGAFGYAADESNLAVTAVQTVITADKSLAEAPVLLRGASVNLPVRTLCEALGYDVSWSAESGKRIVTAISDNDEIAMDLDDQSVTKNGHDYYLASNDSGYAFFLYNGSAYLESGVFSDVFGVNVRYDEAMKTAAVTKLKENAITISNVKLSSEDDNYKLTLQYPQITGLGSLAAQSAVNAVFAEAASDAVSEGLTAVYDMIDVRRDYPDYTVKCETNLNYLINYNQNGLLSISLYDYQYTGGAHGMTTQKSYTFDLGTGSVLTLADLMDGASDYVSFISKAVRTEIDARVASGNLVEFEGSEFKAIDKDQNFFLKNDALVVYFQQYEYFPYAAGIQEFPIAFTALEDLLKPEYGFLADGAVRLLAGADNALSAGDIAFVALEGNPTTGYGWYYDIGDESILAPDSDGYATAGSGLIGAGGTYFWRFKALKSGQTAITFRYYRSWEGESSAAAENTIVYNVTVG